MSLIENDFDSEKRKRERMQRFASQLKALETSELEYDDESFVATPKKIRGTSTTLEKPYFRLTSAPKVSSIRPLQVLKESLKLVREKYIEKNEDYSYACEQLKSIRQDLTVQNINNRFTAHVYETHGRISLEEGDLSEYNQCQSRLQELRKIGVRISHSEFDCYRILHSIFQHNQLELVSILRELAADISNCTTSNGVSPLSFAIEVIKASRNLNTKKFFSLYKSPPGLSG
jgi:hypothetical protein